MQERNLHSPRERSDGMKQKRILYICSSHDAMQAQFIVWVENIKQQLGRNCQVDLAGSRILTPYAVLEFSDHIPQLQALVQYDRIAGEGAGKDGKVMEMLLGEKG